MDQLYLIDKLTKLQDANTCDEKFGAGHVCKNKQLFMVTLDDKEENLTEQDEPKLIWDVDEECNP